jgi:hypothetical protein
MRLSIGFDLDDVHGSRWIIRQRKGSPGLAAGAGDRLNVIKISNFVGSHIRMEFGEILLPRLRYSKPVLNISCED